MLGSKSLPNRAEQPCHIAVFSCGRFHTAAVNEESGVLVRGSGRTL
jgi:hypothetical protein